MSSPPPVSLSPLQALRGHPLVVVGGPPHAENVARLAGRLGVRAAATNSAAEVPLDADRVVLVGPRFRSDLAALPPALDRARVVLLPLADKDCWSWYSLLTPEQADFSLTDGRLHVGREWLHGLLIERGQAVRQGDATRVDPSAFTMFPHPPPERQRRLARVAERLGDAPSRAAYLALTKGSYAGNQKHFWSRILTHRQQYLEYGRMATDAVILNLGLLWGFELPFFGLLAPAGRCINIDPLGEDYRSDYVRAFQADSAYGLGVEPVAAGAEPGTMSFHRVGSDIHPQIVSMDGFVCDRPKETVTVEPLDDLVARLKLDRVDAIKMDIEGGEPEALAGARSTIRRHRPLLMISIYHARRHYYEIPESIMETTRDLRYSYHFNWYSWAKGEAIFYAVPDQLA